MHSEEVSHLLRNGGGVEARKPQESEARPHTFTSRRSLQILPTLLSPGRKLCVDGSRQPGALASKPGSNGQVILGMRPVLPSFICLSV